MKAVMKCAVLCVLMLMCTVGCLGPRAPMGFPQEIGEVGKAIAISAADQAVWDRLVGRIHGQVIEPGLEGYAGVLYVAGGRLKGFSGQIALEGDGHGSGEMTNEAREAILRELNEGERQALLLRLLGINPTPPEDGPVADEPEEVQRE